MHPSSVYRIHAIVSRGVWSFFVIISCDFRSRAVHIFSLPYRKVFYALRHSLAAFCRASSRFAFSSFWHNPSCDLRPPSQDGLWWTEGSCSCVSIIARVTNWTRKVPLRRETQGQSVAAAFICVVLILALSFQFCTDTIRFFVAFSSLVQCPMCCMLLMLVVFHFVLALVSKTRNEHVHVAAVSKHYLSSRALIARRFVVNDKIVENGWF